MPRKLTAQEREQRERLFDEARLEINRLRGAGEFASDIAQRLFAAGYPSIKLSSLTGILRSISCGMYRNMQRVRGGEYRLGDQRLTEMLTILRALEPQRSAPPGEHTRRAMLARGIFEPIHLADDLRLELEDCARCIRAWRDAGVSPYRLTFMLREHGFTGHYSKLSRLAHHGPERPDRPDCFVLSREKTQELRAALESLGEPAGADAEVKSA